MLLFASGRPTICIWYFALHLDYLRVRASYAISISLLLFNYWHTAAFPKRTREANNLPLNNLLFSNHSFSPPPTPSLEFRMKERRRKVSLLLSEEVVLRFAHRAIWIIISLLNHWPIWLTLYAHLPGVPSSTVILSIRQIDPGIFQTLFRLCIFYLFVSCSPLLRFVCNYRLYLRSIIRYSSSPPPQF